MVMTNVVRADKLEGVGAVNRWFPQSGRFVRKHPEIAVSKGYVVFHCPACGTRMRRPAASGEEVKILLPNGVEDKALAWTCHGCCRKVPVLPPAFWIERREAQLREEEQKKAGPRLILPGSPEFNCGLIKTD